MEMNRKDIKHQLALMAQDRIFCRNAHIQQKILGALLAVCSMVVWITLTMYDTVQIWWGVEFFPLPNRDRLRLHAVYFKSSSIGVDNFDIGITWRLDVIPFSAK